MKQIHLSPQKLKVTVPGQTFDWFALFIFAVCKFKAHKRCAVRATNNCKWTTLASIGKDIIEDEDGVSVLQTRVR